jgi:S1-C subfamily serine protease
VADLAETYRFNPTNPRLAQPSHHSPTNPLGHGPALYPVADAPVRHRAKGPSWSREQKKTAWLLVLVIILALLGAGIAIGVKAVRSRRSERIQRAQTPTPGEIIQRSLGFESERVSESEFPGIRGVFVKRITSDDSPAAVAGIEAGDILRELNGRPVRNDSELKEALDGLSAGATVPVAVYRDGESVAGLTLRIADPALFTPSSRTNPREEGFLGIQRTDRRRVANSPKWGIQVRDVRTNHPADLAGLQTGDIILEFDGKRVRTEEEFLRRIRLTKPRSKVKVKFQRGDAEHIVDIIVGTNS